MPARSGSGRKAKPTALKLLDGNPGKKPLPKNEPQPFLALPPTPAWMTLRAKREYRRVGALLLSSKMVTVLDGFGLAMVASSYATWVEAEIAVQEHGLLVKGRDGAPAVNPFRRVANEAYDRTRQMLVEFGMTPSSRTRVKTVESATAVGPVGEWWEQSG